MKLEYTSQGNVLQVQLPIAIVSESNRRDHWAAAHRRHKVQRSQTQLAMRSVLSKFARRWPASIKLTYFGPRRMDDGNIAAALKHVQDGVADALGIDDGKLRWQYESIGGRKNRTVQVTIYWEKDHAAARATC